MHQIKALFDPELMLNPGVLLNADEHIHIKNLKTMPLADPLIDLCIECGFCEPACPSAGMTLSPRQRIVVTREMARLEASGEDPARLAAMHEGFKYAGMDTCAACNLCSLRCPVGIETGTLILGDRAERRTPSAQTIAHWTAANTGIVESLMAGAVGAQALSRNIIGDGATDALARTARKLSGDRIPRVSRVLARGPGAPKSVTTVEAPLGKIVYFPSCATRMFGTPKTEYDLLSTPDAMVALIKRAGYEPIVAEHLTGQCCGQPFLSKGFPDDARKVGDKLESQLSTLSDHGDCPVVTDASTCAKHMREHHGETQVADSAEFLLANILPHLVVNRPLPVLAIHHNCSAQRMKEQASIEALAAAIAVKTAVLSSVTCCGYAGDKGLFFPELNAHATRFAKNDIPPDCTIGVSTVSTCASGLSEHAGIPFVSFASLLEYVSRPK